MKEPEKKNQFSEWIFDILKFSENHGYISELDIWFFLGV